MFDLLLVLLKGFVFKGVIYSHYFECMFYHVFIWVYKRIKKNVFQRLKKTCLLFKTKKTQLPNKSKSTTLIATLVLWCTLYILYLSFKKNICFTPKNDTATALSIFRSLFEQVTWMLEHMAVVYVPEHPAKLAFRDVKRKWFLGRGGGSWVGFYMFFFV